MHTIEDFCDDLRKNDNAINHSHTQMVYGFALLLLDKKEEAMLNLTESQRYLNHNYMDINKKIIALLENDDIDKAKEIVLNNEQFMRKLLKID